MLNIVAKELDADDRHWGGVLFDDKSMNSSKGEFFKEFKTRGSRVGPQTKQNKNRHRDLLSDPMFRLSRAIGVFYLTEDLKVSKKTMVIGVVFFIVLHTERILFLIYHSFQENMRTITIIFVSAYHINWWLAMFMPTGSLRRALKEFSSILQKLELDYTMSWWLFTAFIFVLMKLVLSAINLTRPLQLATELSHALLTLPTLLLPLQYATLTRHFAKAFTALHNKLPASDDDELQRLAAIHCRLCNLSRTINHHYGPPILLSVCVIIALSMSFVYLFVSSSRVAPKEFVRMGFRICYVLCACMSAVATATHLRHEVEQFNYTLRNILISRVTINEEVLKLYIRVRMVVNPTACDFFSLRPTLFTKIFAGLISYTVILLQFSGAKIPITA